MSITRREKEEEWATLLDIPTYRERTETEEVRLTELTAELYPKPIDNSERIAALFRELDECNVFQRALEIEQELRGYGVEAIDPQENRELERYASRQRGQRYGAL